MSFQQYTGDCKDEVASEISVVIITFANEKCLMIEFAFRVTTRRLDVSHSKDVSQFLINIILSVKLNTLQKQIMKMTFGYCCLCIS